MAEADGRSRPSLELVECSLFAEFDLGIEPVEWCPLADVEPPIAVRNQRFRDGTCLIDAQVRGTEGEERTVRITQDCAVSCPSKVLTDAGYVPELEEIHPERVVLGVCLDDRGEVPRIVERLRPVTERISLRQLVAIDQDQTVDRSVLDLRDLTEKQRSAVTIAIAEGYYRRPRRASIGDIAGALDISPAAASQRLKAVESKLMRRVFAEPE
jgi:predicted DNA binding protein